MSSKAIFETRMFIAFVLAITPSSLIAEAFLKLFVTDKVFVESDTTVKRYLIRKSEDESLFTSSRTSALISRFPTTGGKSTALSVDGISACATANQLLI